MIVKENKTIPYKLSFQWDNEMADLYYMCKYVLEAGSDLCLKVDFYPESILRELRKQQYKFTIRQTGKQEFYIWRIK